MLGYTLAWLSCPKFAQKNVEIVQSICRWYCHSKLHFFVFFRVLIEMLKDFFFSRSQLSDQYITCLSCDKFGSWLRSDVRVALNISRPLFGTVTLGLCFLVTLYLLNRQGAGCSLARVCHLLLDIRKLRDHLRKTKTNTIKKIKMHRCFQ